MVEKSNGFEFYKPGENYRDTPNARYGLDGATRPTAFRIYKNILKPDSFEIVLGAVNGVWDTKHYDPEPFIRKSDKKPLKEQDLFNAIVSDDLKLCGRAHLKTRVQSKQSPNRTVYDIAYQPPGEYAVRNNKRGFEDGWVEIVASKEHTNALGGHYDESAAYRELKSVLTGYCGAPDQCRESTIPKSENERELENSAEKESISRIGKGEHSGTNFRPVRRRK